MPFGQISPVNYEDPKKAAGWWTKRNILIIYHAMHKNTLNNGIDKSKPILVAERSKARVCGRLFAGVAGSNPAKGMDICVVCVVQ